MANHVSRLGHYVAACAMFGSMLRFFSLNHKETTEYLLASYKYGSFGKVCSNRGIFISVCGIVVVYEC